ncbi:unnamed protein product, partial [Ectocarpus sp. 8 AP-2014]
GFWVGGRGVSVCCCSAILTSSGASPDLSGTAHQCTVAVDRKTIMVEVLRDLKVEVHQYENPPRRGTRFVSPGRLVWHLSCLFASSTEDLSFCLDRDLSLCVGRNLSLLYRLLYRRSCVLTHKISYNATSFLCGWGKEWQVLLADTVLKLNQRG